MPSGGRAVRTPAVVRTLPWLALAVTTSALAGLGGCTGEEDAAEAASEREPPPAIDPALLAAGRAHYDRLCALCHGADGEGYAADNAPRLTSDDFLAVASDEFLSRAISEGHPGTPMAGFAAAHGGPLNDPDIAALVAYLRSRGPQAVDVAHTRVLGDAERGRPIYERVCAECHGLIGEGVSAPTLAHPTFRESASDGYLRRTIAGGRAGTPMRAFQEELTSQEIDDLVLFLRALPPLTVPTPAALPAGPPPPDFEHIVLNPDGPAPDFHPRDDRFVPGAEVHAALEAGARIVLLDARAISSWAEGHIPGAAPFPYYTADDLASHLPDDGTWIIAYCACPHAASGHVVDELRRRGFEHAMILDEGIPWWIAQGYPTERGDGSSPGAGTPVH